MTIIAESKLNKASKSSMRFVAFFFIIFGFLFFILQLFLFDKGFAIIGLPIIIIGFYFKGRIASVYEISPERIILAVGSKKVAVEIKDILYISKNIRFTINDRFWWVLYFRKSEGFPKRDRLFFMNEIDYNFPEIFNQMEIQLKNIN